MRTSFLALVAIPLAYVQACDLVCDNRCYVDYFWPMEYGHGIINSAPGSINGWPQFYNIPANASIDNAAPGPWGSFPILEDTSTLYNGTQEFFAIVTWGEYGSWYETSNIIDYGIDNDGIQIDCGGPDEE